MVLSEHVIFWVNGSPIDIPLSDRGIGHPICMGCENHINTGIVFRGNGGICKNCMDEFRNDLWDAINRILNKSNT